MIWFYKTLSYQKLIIIIITINLGTIGYSRSSLLEGTHTHMQIKYSYIYTDTYTTNNYNVITKLNIIKQQQHYTNQTTNTCTLQQQKIQQRKQYNKTKNQVLS